MSKFVHLHVHSHFSTLDGVGTPEENVLRAKENGQTAIALTDHGNMCGLLEHQRMAKKHGIKAILGNEMYICDNHTLKGLTDEEKKDLTPSEVKEENKRRRRSCHILILAKDEIGLKNLYQLNYFANKDGFYFRPRIDYNLLEQYSEGLICTTACIIGPSARPFLDGDHEKSLLNFERLLSIFGKEDFYLEFQANELKLQSDYNKFCVNKLLRYGVKPIITCDAHYPYKEQNELQAFVQSLNNDDFLPQCKNLYIMNDEELESFWNETGNMSIIGNDLFQQCLKNTKEIESKCNAIIDDKTLKEPEFKVPEGFDSNIEYLQHLVSTSFRDKVQRGLIKKKDVPKYLERLKYEISTIKSKGFVDYFLTVRKIVKWAKDGDIMVGPARGSAAGSLLSWLLYITEIDPVKYNLTFDRFLNPLRDKSPDIDVDFQDEKRDDVKDYIAREWGESNIANIVTFSQYQSNNAFRDVCKKEDIPFSQVNEVAKTIQSVYHGRAKSFQQNLDEQKKLNEFLDSLPYDQHHRLVRIVKGMEGRIKNLGTNAAGVIISSRPLQEIMPLRKDQHDKITTEWDGDSVSDAKFLKFDILGLKTLSLIKSTLDKVNLDMKFLYDMPLDISEASSEEMADDLVTCYEQFCKGSTEAIFQFEGGGIVEWIKRLQPQTLNDICSLNSLYRPGPLISGLADEYVNRKNSGGTHENMIHNSFNDILSETYGTLLYQEQTIDILNRMGLSYGEADLMRRAMESENQNEIKKYVDLIMERESEFENYEKQDIIEKVLKFAGYSFNKSHSVAYAVIAIWTMYLKIKYPIEFYESLLNLNMGDEDKLSLYVHKVLNVFEDYTLNIGDINNCFGEFTIQNNQINLPVTLVKGLGESVLQKIYDNRPITGWKTFESFFNDSVKNTIMSVNDVKNLIRLGYFDKIPFNDEGLTLNRKTLYTIYEIVGELAKLSKRKREEILWSYECDKISDLFKKKKLENVVNLDTEEYSKEELSKFEFDLYGFYANTDINEYVDAIKDHIGGVSDWESPEKPVWGMIQSVLEKKTKKGGTYLLVKMADKEGSVHFKVWQYQIGKVKEKIINGNLVILNLNKDKFGYTIARGSNVLTQHDFGD